MIRSARLGRARPMSTVRACHYRPQVMSTQATTHRASAVAFIAALLLFAQAGSAATLEGRIAFPGRELPAATVYAHNVANAELHQAELRRNEATFRMELPAGKYWVFVQPREPGLTELYGAHTRYSVCRRQPAHLSEACNDHALQEVDVAAGRSPTLLEVDDWFLDESAAQALDRILGTAPAAPDQAELGRPRFSEYRAAAPAVLPADVKLRLPEGGKAAAFTTELAAAVQKGVTFAAVFALARLRCGEACEQVALVDLSDGTVLFPETLTQVSTSLPCRAHEVLGYRDDSRLLEFTHREADAVVTDYLLWDNARADFTLLAQYRRSAERFCASTAATGRARAD